MPRVSRAGVDQVGVISGPGGMEGVIVMVEKVLVCLSVYSEGCSSGEALKSAFL